MERDRPSARQLSTAPSIGPRQDEIDLVATGRVQDVELEPRADRLRNGILAEIVIARKRLAKPWDGGRGQIKDDVNVAGKAWLAVDAAAPGTEPTRA
jgi:hypothetical protein